jgi:hypothetical protein
MSRHAWGTTVWLALLAVLLAAAPEVRAQRSRQAQTRFQAMDENGDGVISRAEWRGSAQSFSRHDWNDDGVLSGNEVRIGAAREPAGPSSATGPKAVSPISIAIATAGSLAASGSTIAKGSSGPIATPMAL